MERVPAPDTRNTRTVLPEGTVIGGYTLHHHGFGGMSAVYRGLKDGNTYLVKEVEASNSFQVLALTQEKGLLERLNHPGIVRFVALFEENGYYYMVQEFIEGRSMEHRQDHGDPISEAEVRDWALQLCDIFSYLHRQDPPVIYRDLKPGNLILQGERVRLIDFGIARVYKGERVQDTDLLGSFVTASPEHYGAAETDVRSDVFTLGATLFDLLSEGKRRNELPSHHPPLREVTPSVSAEIEAVVMTALAERPENRFQSMDEMRDALSPGARPKPRKPAAPSPGRRGALGAGLVLLTVLLVVGLAAARLFTGPAAPPQHEEHGPTEDTGLLGSVFGGREDKGFSIVTLGEDIGLFRVMPAPRAPELVQKLNKMYHTQCPTCRVYRLEPEGIRIGTYTDAGGKSETALFYAHNDPNAEGQPQWREITLLTVVDQAQADAMKTTKKLVAGYWRDLLRDLVELSRGREGGHSPLSAELQAELLAARRRLGPDASMANLWEVLQELTGEKTMELRTSFEKVPAGYKCRSDRFEPFASFAPLKS